MRSRGIPEDEARTMLMQAFMMDVADTVKMDGLRDRLRHLVERRLSGHKAVCADCDAATDPLERTEGGASMNAAYDIDGLRRQFPILGRTVYGRPLIYLDNAATSQTPECVVDSIVRMYTHTKANAHRGVHGLSQEATDLQEAARERVRAFINAESTDEVIFTRGTTEGINLVASSMGQLPPEGSEVIVSVMGNHANIVPWQLLGEAPRHHAAPCGDDSRRQP